MADRGAPDERRRWFASPDIDLIVWFDETDVPIAFQLCYDKRRAERALTWRSDIGFVHMAVDTGERQDGLRYKATPILIDGGAADLGRMTHLLSAASRRVPPGIAEFVTSKLRQHPDYPRTT